MRFKGLDLNLLVALDALLEEQSVSRAAEQLHLSQPAMSAALSRIRDYFDDPILNLHGKRMVPTSHALKIQGEIKAVLESVDSLISKTSIFDPATSSRKFTITASDYLTQIIFVPLLRELTAIAPDIQMEILPPADSTPELLAQGRIDFIAVPEQALLKSMPSEFLFEERFVVVGCETNPLFEKGLTEKDFYEAGHVVAKLGEKRPLSVSDQGLALRKRPRETDVIISSFLLAPEIVVGTDRLTVMHERLAKVFSQRLPIAVAEMPFKFPPLREYVQYLRARRDDSGIRWMINQVKNYL